MGVPAFYRWLSEKYPKVVEDVLEERVKVMDGSTVPLPFDATRPNPSGLECDNLYIDMNGIIHPCSHPEHGPQPQTEEEMYENVCRYVDRLFRAIRPRKLLYLAIDGVAPRAKMNQQRSRRFRSAQEAREQLQLEESIREELQRNGGTNAPPPPKKPWDSNVITPGTPFMIRLAEFLRFYIRKRITTDKAWKTIRVVFSDASIPGEGEHKIMSHIRLQRSQPGYDPNLVHILHGLDADLIMLALATHEAHFYISRELVLFGRKSKEQHEQRQLESGFQDAQRLLDEDAGSMAMESLLENQGTPLQRISIPILREYLAHEFASCLQPGRVPFAPSLERLLDDVVFLCFFVGNDFLPHLPSLDIRDGALDYLFNVYKRVLPTLGDYITNHGGAVNLSHVDVILGEVGNIEDYVFAMKHENEQREKQRQAEYRQNRKQLKKPEAPPLVVTNQNTHAVKGRAARILERKNKNNNKNNNRAAVALKRGFAAKEENRKQLRDANAKAALELKKSLGKGFTTKKEEKADGIKKEEQDQDVAMEEEEEKKSLLTGTKFSAEEMQVKKEESNGDAIVKQDNAAENGDDDGVGDDDDDDEEEDANPIPSVVEEVDPEVAKAFKEKVKAAKQKQLDQYAKNVEDKVRLHEPGWKDRYYTDKCKADDVTAHGGREHLFRSYVVGLCWVMKYYYDGCPSWKWYYPFHYAPFASDLKNIERFSRECKTFELNQPFKPVEQLMAVLPEDSSHAIPKPSRWLMSDEESPIIDFYPKDVPVDPNGKAMPWLWVVLLPFIDEERLLAAMKGSMDKWTNEDHFCNSRGLDDGYVYMHKDHEVSDRVVPTLQDENTAKSRKARLSSLGVRGFSGSVRLPLSNEIYKLGDDVVIRLPSTAQEVKRASHDNLFAETIEGNVVVCASFTEPAKLSHKSVLLPGARPPPPTLKPEDKIIRRPRLNRGGGTIANLGGSSKNGQSYQSGYGSMNISNYERDLAARQGRGGQMYQTGTRAWGAMEPTPKRQRPNNNNPPRHDPYPSNPFNRPPPNYTPQAPQPQSYNRPPWQQQQQQQQRQQPQQQQPYSRPQLRHSQHPNAPYSGQQYNHQQQQQPYHRPAQQQRSHQQYPNNGRQQGYQAGYQHSSNQQHAHQQRNNNYNQNVYQQQRNQGYNQGGHNRPYSGQQQQQQQTNFSFQGYNRSAQPGQYLQQQNGGQPTQSRVNPNVMNNLRSQLANTLQQHRRGGQTRR